MNTQAEVLAPAKINLALHITGKRPDGFHTLKTVMQSVSLCDIVTVEKTDGEKGIEISCTDKSIPTDGRNIVFKAAEAFFNRTNIPNRGIKIHIEKHIPSEAGLGGGSSDGAAVFAALNRLYGEPLTEEELCSLSAGVGADIPFCIKGGTTLCEGIGEILTPIKPLPDCHIVIGKGEKGVSTKEAYNAIDRLPESTGCGFDTALFEGSIEEIAGSCFNVFEQVSGNDEISSIKEAMLACGALCSVMSGSGSAVFGIFTDEERAEKCAIELGGKGFYSALCRPIAHGAKIIGIK
ncbi:MAG: 4-(cytidine 5'-diphospho)-2-C-methyl-D-erythritol kinase [Oscillospiraceae bacterium]